MTRSTALYRAFDADGGLLYVGITMNVAQRTYAHGRDKDWWTEVARIDVEHFGSRDEAVRAETRVISAESPRHNIRPGASAARSDEELARRRAIREERDRKFQEQMAATYVVTDRSVRCANCGHRPHRLPKGTLIVELDCPTCACPGLEVTERAAA